MSNYSLLENITCSSSATNLASCNVFDSCITFCENTIGIQCYGMYSCTTNADNLHLAVSRMLKRSMRCGPTRQARFKHRILFLSVSVRSILPSSIPTCHYYTIPPRICRRLVYICPTTRATLSCLAYISPTSHLTGRSRVRDLLMSD